MKGSNLLNLLFVVKALLVIQALDLTVHSKHIIKETRPKLTNLKVLNKHRGYLYRLSGGGNGTVVTQQGRTRGHVSITRVSSMGLLNPYFHDEDLGFSLFLERR
jgi:hypothetical protein